MHAQLPHLDSGAAVFLFDRKQKEGPEMDTRVAVMSVIVEGNGETVETLNAILHDYGQYIIGRMGIPYRQRGVNIISIAIDAPQDTISALSGKIGKLAGVSVKTAFSNVRSSSHGE
jgi:putative iron-only hydrogenase system regulator